MNGLLIALLVVVVAACVVTLVLMRRWLRAHEAAIAGTVSKHARDHKTAITAAESAIKTHAASQLAGVTAELETLGAAVRARILADMPASRGRRAAAAKDPAASPAPAGRAAAADNSSGKGKQP